MVLLSAAESNVGKREGVPHLQIFISNLYLDREWRKKFPAAELL